MAIKDKRGKIPNYVVHKGRVIHQPTGMFEELSKGHTRMHIARAHAKLTQRVEVHQQGLQTSGKL